MSSSYQPLFIKGPQTGLVQSREEFLLPSDAFPVLENAYVWRERIKRKQAYQLLGRLRRTLTAQALGSSNSTLITQLTLEPSAEVQAGSVVITDGTNTYTDNGLGILVGSPNPANAGTINYTTTAYAVTGSIAPLTVTFSYYPCLPVMGIRSRDLSPLNTEMTVFFDTRYAYNFAASGFVEFIPGTTWSYLLSEANSNFFWTTNYWVSAANIKLFWATNFSGTSGDPIRYTDGTGNGSGTWTDFGSSSPTSTGKIDSAGNFLNQCLCLLPFRNRLVAFNTLEGINLATSVSYSNRIRWSAIGNPLTVDSVGPPITRGAWRDDIRGLGGFIDIPTNEDIVTVGIVRDNLVIYCEGSTWQLRYTGQSIAPFQIEKVSPSLGAGSTFSGIEFDESLVGIGDKGIVECNSYKSNLIDIKIPDLVINHINNNNFGQKRVHGIRDFLNRLAYWTYPESDSNGIFPDKRLVYNYENDSWAIFTDSLTALGTFQPTSSRTWANPTGGSPSTKLQWQEANFPWVSQPASILSIVGGNQQGYVEYLDQQTTNDASLTITSITGNTTTPTQITSANHNLQTGQVISISSIPTGTPFATSLNGNVFGVIVNSSSTFLLMVYNSSTGQFSSPQLDATATYIGAGQISVRDNFRIVSKKFNFLDDGQNIQIGYIDILMPTSVAGAISLNVYVDYNDNQPSNNQPNNQDPDTGQADTFFNTTISTAAHSAEGANSSKTNQRVFCAIRGNYLTLEYTFSNAQLNGIEQENDVQIDMQVIWQRAAGRISNVQGS